MNKILVTGGSGFFGHILLQALVDSGFECVNIDLVDSELVSSKITHIKGDIRDLQLLERLAESNRFDAIIHCAAILAHGLISRKAIWTTNVDGTKNIATIADKFNIKKVIFTSSNCLWGNHYDRPIVEDDEPCPVELYGKSKREGELILLNEINSFKTIIFRCPTIIDSGRLGLLGILFEFIFEGRKIWVVGNGNNFYQFIYAKDLASACIKALDYGSTDIFNIGSDNVKSFNEIYNFVIRKASSKSVVKSLPKKLTLFIMKIAHKLRLSPLGPYHYKMIAESFIFDTKKIKKHLNWSPTLTNEEMLYKAYNYYHTHKNDIENRKAVSAHRKVGYMGIIRLLKWIS